MKRKKGVLRRWIVLIQLGLKDLLSGVPRWSPRSRVKEIDHLALFLAFRKRKGKDSTPE